MTKAVWLIIIFFVAIVIVFGRPFVTSSVHAQTPSLVPILVELFTSEGCSSCPPADALLEKLDRSQPISGAQLIVLSEHVDYWNHIGWVDPYSSPLYSERQNLYAERFQRDSVYTPQMVVDGRSEFVGSDVRSAERALNKALKAPKVGIRLSAMSIDEKRDFKAHVETESLPASFGQSQSDVYLAVVLSHSESRVSGGENSGRRLVHVGVVRSLMKIGVLRQAQNLVKDIPVKLDSNVNPQNVRLVAFIQEPGAGEVIGATMESLVR